MRKLQTAGGENGGGKNEAKCAKSRALFADVKGKGVWMSSTKEGRWERYRLGCSAASVAGELVPLSPGHAGDRFALEGRRDPAGLRWLRSSLAKPRNNAA